MEYKTFEEQLRYIWPFGTGCGRLKLPSLALNISLLSSNSNCPLVRHIHVSHGKRPLALCVCLSMQWHTQEFCLGGGFQQIQLRTEDRENRDLGGQ